MANQESILLLHLSLIQDIGPVTINKILTSTVPLDQLYTLSAQDFIQLCRLSVEQAKKIIAGLADTDLLEKELALIDRHAITWASRLDETYPDQLSHIESPPVVLYWRGSASAAGQKQIAFVGARRAKHYARRSLEHIIPDLVNHDWTIVSGGAVGADAMAHQITLEQGGRTIAVLGSGLLCPYPRVNISLFEDIITSGGALVSPFPLLTEPLAGNFPARNRIIVGLSSGCVVVQAARKSGALISAYHALEQGKEVFALPGQIDDELSVGCHDLIRQGAHLVTSAQDILDVYDMAFASTTVPQKSSIRRQKKSLDKKKTKKLALNPEEQSIVNSCRVPMSLDELLDKTALPLDTITAHVFELQLKGILKQTVSGLWELA